ncbi:Maf family protein [Sediminibacterium goheungense]|uniref:dTTP/UTP pyrophosphatase n=1 Tax=Sediminibacterium goheungense TaxID=1086393 RepID=A0A4R6IZF8_9BACT|nr:Maf family nucleotide pyrophosphatase [Sediminibacterium goheungense]TDO28284.1 septum formation protein [Sediminibacterium goheungense]
MIPIILASQSPRRKMLLEWAELSFEIVVKPTDESFPAELPIEEVPIFIAKEKAVTVRNHIQQTGDDQYAGRPILAADTVVVLNGEIIGKPNDRDHAITILKKLSGQVHQVITGVVILSGEIVVQFADITEVQFYSLTDEQISFYVDKYHPYDKAGAYAIQEWIGVVGIQSVKGDFYNVMGLPVSRVVKALQALHS